MAQARTKAGGIIAGLGAAALLAACFVSADNKSSLTCDELAERGLSCDPIAGTGGVGGQGGTAGQPVMGQGGAGTGGTNGGGTGGSGGVTCIAPTTECGGACVDVKAADAANCGECGYACGAGSTCAEGACAAVAVVSNVVAPYAFAIDAENVYFVVPVVSTVGGAKLPVQKAPRGGGGAVPVPFSGDPTYRARSIVLANGALFFGDLDSNGVLRKGATAGGDVDTYLADQPAVQHLVAADGRLWWATFDGTSRLRRVTATGTPAAAEELLPGPSFLQLGRVPALAVEGTGVSATAFWVNVGGSAPTDKGLWRKAGAAAPAKLVAGGAMVTLALGESEVFVADSAAGISKAATNAMAPVTLGPVVSSVEVGGAVQGLVVAQGKLYWLAFNAGQLELHRSGLDGADARVLGRVAAKSAAYWGQPIGPAQLVVDGGFVYFSDAGTVTGDLQDDNLSGVTGAADGAIYRLPQ